MRADITRGFALAFVGGFALAAYRASFSVQYPAIVSDLGWSSAGVTLAYAVSMPTYAVSSVAVGMLVDRVGARVPMLAGLILLSAAAYAGAFVTEQWQLVGTWGVVSGLGLSGVGFAAVLKSLVLLNPERLGLTLSGHHVGQGAAVLLITPALQSVSGAFDWRLGQLAMATAFALFLPLIAALAPGRRGIHRGHASGPTVVDVASLRSIPIALLLMSILSMGYWSIIPTHQVAHLALEGFSYAEAANLAGLSGLTGVIGGLAAGAAVQRWPVGRVLVAATIFLAAGTLALATVVPGELWLITAFVIGTGGGRGALGLMLGILEGRLLSLRSIGRMSGTLEIGMAAGVLTGPTLAAVWRDGSGSLVPGLLTAAIAAGSCGLFGLLSLQSSQRRTFMSAS